MPEHSAPTAYMFVSYGDPNYKISAFFLCKCNFYFKNLVHFRYSKNSIRSTAVTIKSPLCKHRMVVMPVFVILYSIYLKESRKTRIDLNPIKNFLD